MEQTAKRRRGSGIAKAFKERLDKCWKTIFPDITLSLVKLLITVHGFGMKVLFTRPFNSDFDFE